MRGFALGITDSRLIVGLDLDNTLFVWPETVAIRGHVDTVRAGVDDLWDAYARWVSEALARRG